MTRVPDLNYQTPYAQRGNGLGIAGFIVSIIGLFTCGVLGPVGLILSAFGMRKEPRGLAIAGLVIGIVGTLEFIAIIAFSIFVTFSAARAGAAFAAAGKTFFEMQSAKTHIESYYRAHKSTLPADADGNAAIVELDDWGHRLQYQLLTPTEFELHSAGPDGIFATVDDITQNFDTADFFSTHFPTPPPPPLPSPPATAPAPAPEIE